jgi:hypothetical protein
MTERGAGGGGLRGGRSGISSACGFPKQDFWFALEIFFCLAIDSPFLMDKMDSRGFMEMFVFSSLLKGTHHAFSRSF